MIICPYKSFKVFSIFCQILNNLPKNCQRSFKFCQSGKISPNLVTLVPSNILIGKENFLLWRNSNSDPSEAKSKMFWQLHPRSLNDKTIEIAISKFYIFEHWVRFGHKKVLKYEWITFEQESYEFWEDRLLLTNKQRSTIHRRPSY